MKLKLPSKIKNLGIKEGIYKGRIDEAEFSIEVSRDTGDFPVILKDNFIEIPDDIVSKVHLNADKEFEVDLVPADDYSKRYKDKFSIVII